MPVGWRRANNYCVQFSPLKECPCSYVCRWHLSHFRLLRTWKNFATGEIGFGLLLLQAFWFACTDAMQNRSSWAEATRHSCRRRHTTYRGQNVLQTRVHTATRTYWAELEFLHKQRTNFPATTVSVTTEASTLKHTVLFLVIFFEWTFFLLFFFNLLF